MCSAWPVLFSKTTRPFIEDPAPIVVAGSTMRTKAVCRPVVVVEGDEPTVVDDAVGCAAPRDALLEHPVPATPANAATSTTTAHFMTAMTLSASDWFPWPHSNPSTPVGSDLACRRARQAVASGASATRLDHAVGAGRLAERRGRARDGPHWERLAGAGRREQHLGPRRAVPCFGHPAVRSCTDRHAGVARDTRHGAEDRVRRLPVRMRDELPRFPVPPLDQRCRFRPGRRPCTLSATRSRRPRAPRPGWLGPDHRSGRCARRGRPTVR